MLTHSPSMSLPRVELAGAAASASSPSTAASAQPAASSATPWEGYGFGLLGVLIFSLTLPMTRMVVAEWPPLLVGLGRALVAAVPAAVLLAVNCSRLPRRQEWSGVLGAALGIVIGWPLLSTLALQSVSASHGAVFNGLLPLSTALFAAWRSGEKPARAFWVWAAVGAVLVTGFGLRQGQGALQAGDLWLLLAVVAGGMGYAEGARAARTLGGGRTICWALVISAPLIAVPVAWMAGDAADAARISGQVTSNRALLAFAWLSFGSMFLGFFAWYRGLAVGGIARVGQVQLLQPFLTVLACALLFGEPVSGETWVFALAVIGVIVGGRRALRTASATAGSPSKP